MVEGRKIARDILFLIAASTNCVCGAITLKKIAVLLKKKIEENLFYFCTAQLAAGATKQKQFIFGENFVRGS